MLGHALFFGCFAISLSIRQVLRCTAGDRCAGCYQAQPSAPPQPSRPPSCPLPPHQGNILVDVPRWTPLLAQRLAALGGVRWIFLTHRWALVGLGHMCLLCLHSIAAACFTAGRCAPPAGRVYVSLGSKALASVQVALSTAPPPAPTYHVCAAGTMWGTMTRGRRILAPSASFTGWRRHGGRAPSEWLCLC